MDNVYSFIKEFVVLFVPTATKNFAKDTTFSKKVKSFPSRGAITPGTAFLVMNNGPIQMPLRLDPRNPVSQGKGQRIKCLTLLLAQGNRSICGVLG
jgi:hypothetical protein